MPGRRIALLALCAATFLGSGCATIPYQPGSQADYVEGYLLPEGEPQIVYGRPHRFLDGSDWIWPGSLLAKLLLWNRKVDSHHISPETVQALEAYLEKNELHHVKVRVNAYHVRDEWRRTVRNRGVGAGWRYSIGVLAWLQYTLFPGRFFGGDHYNPYSNTIHLYSDLPSVALHEGGHAKDFARRRWKGTYSFSYMLPLVSLYHEALATSDALGYMRAYESVERQQEGYNILFPAYGTYVGGHAAEWLLFPWNQVAYLGGIIPGHIAGRVRSATLPEAYDEQATAALTTTGTAGP